MEVLYANSGYTPSAPPLLLPAAVPRDPGLVEEVGDWAGRPARWSAPGPAQTCPSLSPADCTGYLTSDCIRQLRDQAAVLLWAGGAFASLELGGACLSPCVGAPQSTLPFARAQPGLRDPVEPPLYEPGAWASLPFDGSSDSSTSSSDFWSAEEAAERHSRSPAGVPRCPPRCAPEGPTSALVFEKGPEGASTRGLEHDSDGTPPTR